MTARFVFDLDAELRKLKCPTANPAKAANPTVSISEISEISKQGEPVDWNTLPDPSTATMNFNQECMDAIKDSQAVPVWSDLLGAWLYWVRDEQVRRKLLSNGCQVPIYTLGELAVVASMGQDDIRKLHRLKTAFNGTIKGSNKR
jgi:hypothetical protein